MLESRKYKALKSQTVKVLFVSSGNSETGISPIVRNQGESLKNGIDLDYFTIVGKGAKGYLKNILRLRRFLTTNTYDLIHAHYTLSGWVAVLSFSQLPIIVSYMGSDTYGSYKENGKRKFLSNTQLLSAKLLQPFVKSIIVKSKNLEKYIYLKGKVNTIPNGVNFDTFRPQNKNTAKKLIGLDPKTKYVLFLGDRNNKRKNFNLLNKAKKLSNGKYKTISPYPIDHNKITFFLNACDVLVMTSYNEGSPNVIKEAMACNCPIVSTDVGDIKWVIGDTLGCYLSSFNPRDVASNLLHALEYSEKYGRTEGRKRLIKLGLDTETIANRIIDVYKSVIKK